MCSVLWIVAMMASACSKQEEPELKCVKAQYLMPYCSFEDRPISYVQLLEPSVEASAYADGDSTYYYAAIVDLPRVLQKENTIFYLSYYVDKKKANAAKPILCPALLPYTNLLICKEANTIGCR